MKKIATLLLAAGLVFSAATGATAIEFDAKGQWIMNFDYGQGGAFQTLRSGPQGVARAKVNGWNGTQDNFNASQRVRLQLDAVASESLSGSVAFEMGDQTWGNFNSGGALGTDGTNSVAVRHAYIDWIVPSTSLKLRMGLQNIALPSYTFTSQVLNNDAAAIAASYQFNDNIGLTFVWTRPLNDNSTNLPDNQANGVFDNTDIFALILPMTFNNVKVTPWAAYAIIGRNSLNGYGNGLYGPRVANGLSPAINYINDDRGFVRPSSNMSAYWVGLTGEVTAGGPFRFAWDANYGATETGISSMDRSGYYVDALFEYKMNWGTPGLYAWYGSGDDGNVKNGSERMPSVSADGVDDRTGLAGLGNPYIGRDGVIASQFTGTWGVGARLKDLSFMENLKHTLRVTYMVGTNSPTMAKYLTGRKTNDAGTTGQNAGYGGGLLGSAGGGAYLTTQDSAIELGLSNTYKIYDNLTMYADLEYMFMFLDEKLWRGGGTQVAPGVFTPRDRSASLTDPWNINVSFVYDF